MAFRREPLPARKLKPLAEPITKAAPWSAPPGALSVWLGPDGDLMVGLPPSAGEAGHSVRISAKRPEVMAKLLLRILAERAAAPFARIVEPGVPTQALADALQAALASGKRVIHAEMRLENLDEADFLA